MRNLCVFCLLIFSLFLACEKENSTFKLSVNDGDTIRVKVGDTVKIHISNPSAINWLKRVPGEITTKINDSVFVANNPGIDSYVAYNEESKSIFSIKVIPHISVMSFSDTIIYTYPGEAVICKLNVSPLYQKEDWAVIKSKIKISSLNPEIASMQEDGAINVHKPGETRIKVQSEYGVNSAEVRIIVVDQPLVIVGNSDNFPVYWNLAKKDLAINLSKNHDMGVAYSVIYTNGSFYSAGLSGQFWDREATYWVNGSRASLETASGTHWSRAYDVASNNTDFFYCGHIQKGNFNVACFWKNGVVTYLDSLRESYASSICATGNMVFTGGIYTNSKNINVACFWSNKNRIDLTDGTTNAAVESLQANGFDTYCAGWYINAGVQNACYWINQTKQNLSSEKSQAKGIFLSGTNIYVVGECLTSNKSQACIWKNGEKVFLDVPLDASASSANSIKFYDNKVYIAGYYKKNNNDVACIWIDNRRVDLVGKSARAYDLAIKK